MRHDRVAVRLIRPDRRRNRSPGNDSGCHGPLSKWPTCFDTMAPFTGKLTSFPVNSCSSCAPSRSAARRLLAAMSKNATAATLPATPATPAVTATVRSVSTKRQKWFCHRCGTARRSLSFARALSLQPRHSLHSLPATLPAV